MDLTTLDFIRITIGVVLLLYVANCLLNQKVWIRKTFSWGTKEEYPKIFKMNIIGGIDWIIFGCKSLLVVIIYCNHKQLDSDDLQGFIRNSFAHYFQIQRGFCGPIETLSDD